jgi:hypothetical protein
MTALAISLELNEHTPTLTAVRDDLARERDRLQAIINQTPDYSLALALSRAVNSLDAALFVLADVHGVDRHTLANEVAGGAVAVEGGGEVGES